ncbi:hypothetical protein HDV05_001513 [Chytridiales sp. JEL 0842]|nr:hypothetical protein HDV05_001513 [Chytridiales sp. JEL 0842]
MSTKPESVVVEAIDDNKTEIQTMASTIQIAGDRTDELIFTDIGYTVIDRVTKQSKTILESITGCVKPGELLAVMGPSGAGKSTFLDVISRRKVGNATGRLFLGNKEVFNTKQMATIGSYVEQEDDLLSVLTVKETIHYAAKLSLPDEPDSKRMERVNEIIVALGLSKCADQIIGNPLQKGISGGQKRRTTIACSLVTFPHILFLDEPTSGLDTTTAREVMGAISQFAAKKRMIVIATIHQPNFETLAMFTDLLLLADGKVMYNGPVAQMGDYFEEFGKPIPRFVNPADHAIDLVNRDFDPVSMELLRISTIAADKANPNDEFSPAKVAEDLYAFEKRYNASKDAAVKAKVANITDKISSRRETNHFFQHTYILSERTVLNYSRNLLAYAVRLAMYIGMGIMMATIWIRLGSADSTINDRLSIFFFSVAFLSFMSVAGIPAFLEERSVFIRERNNGLYKPLPYVLANTIVNLPFMFLCAISFSVLSYWAIGLNPSATAFFRFTAFLWLAIYAAESQVILVSAVIPIFIAALAVGAFANGFWMCVQGYFIRAISLPRFWYYSFHFMDYQKYAFELLLNSDMKGLTFTCKPQVGAPNGCVCAYPSSTPETCTVSGDDVLNYLDVNNINLGHWSIILIGIILIYRILFYVVLVRSK